MYAFIAFSHVKINRQIQEQGCNFIKKESLAQVFSCEFCEIFKNTFIYRTSPNDCFCKSENEGIMTGFVTEEIIEEIFHSLLLGLGESMKGSKFVFMFRWIVL